MIRPGVQSDIQSCLSFQHQTQEDYWVETDFKTMIGNELTIFLVAEEQHQVVGYCVGFIVPTKRTDGALHETRVDVNFRHQGVGTALVNAFCKNVFELGVKTIYASITDEHKQFYIESCEFSVSQEQWIEIEKHSR